MLGYFCLCVCAFLLMLPHARAQDCPTFHTNNFTQPLDSILWLTNSEVSFLFGSGDEPYVWRSTDNGHSWSEPKSMSVDAFEETPVSLYFIGSGELWFSSDAGETFTRSSLVLNLKTFVAHPTVPKFILGGVPKTCPEDFSDSTCYALYFSEDGGQNWAKVNDMVLDFDWGHIPEGTTEDSTIAKSVFVLVIESVSGSQKPVWIKSSDLLASRSVEDSTGVVGFSSFAEDSAVLLLKEDNSLWISEDSGASFFEMKYTPTEANKQTIQYIPVSVKKGSLLIAVTYQHETWGIISDLYLSDRPKNRFLLSIPHIPTILSPTVSLSVHKIQYTSGAYLANIIQYDADSGYGERVTYQTWNFGVTWKRTPAPAGTTCGNNLKTGRPYQSCFLNIHSHHSLTNSRERLGLPLSKKTAIGLIFALGQLGPGLYTAETKLFYSSDGGNTWNVFSSEFAWKYQFTNYGTIMMALNNESLLYSLDYGKTVVKCNPPSGVSGLLLYGDHNTITSDAFLIASSLSSRAHTVIRLTFDNIVDTECSTGNYESFNTPCHLGVSQTLKRKSASSLCYIPSTFTPEALVNVCTCTSQDYRCASCYDKESWNSQSIENSNCVYVCDDITNPHPLPSDCSSDSVYTYPLNSAPSTYVLNSASACSGGVDYTDYTQVLGSCGNRPQLSYGPILTERPSSYGGVATSDDSADIALGILILFVIISIIIVLACIAFAFIRYQNGEDRAGGKPSAVLPVLSLEDLEGPIMGMHPRDGLEDIELNVQGIDLDSSSGMM
eukprot:TRINITY_DN9138_c0_g1_i1.p1 TRINITY_DN9138_c0_g1~~TRINITY_DN9138_c0_g1_i1.p1  ORF type:complete len:777 (+),score=136.04 TRINITY_DN9138_c0_g1_i1:31-2361(+)